MAQKELGGTFRVKDKVRRYVPSMENVSQDILGGGGEGKGRLGAKDACPRAGANSQPVQMHAQPALKRPQGSLRIRKRKGKFSEKEMLGPRRNVKTARMFWGLREATFNTEASSSSGLGQGSPPEAGRGSRTDAH